MDIGLITFPRNCINGLRGDHVLIAPPRILTLDQADEILGILDSALTQFEQQAQA